MPTSLKLLALLVVVITVTTACEATIQDGIGNNDEYTSGTSDGLSNNGTAKSESTGPSASVPPDGSIDCYSGSQEPADSRDYVYQLAPVDRPEGVVAIPLPGAPLDIAVTDDAVWTVVGTADRSGHYQLIKVDAAVNEIAGALELDDAHAVVVGEAVWVSQMWRDTVVQVDADTLELTGSVSMPPLPAGSTAAADTSCFGPAEMDVGEGGLWIDGRGVVAHIDTNELQVRAVIAPPGGEISKGGHIVAGLGNVWVESGGQHVWRIDPQTETWMGGLPIAPESGHAVSELAIADSLLWLSGQNYERDDEGNLTTRIAPEGAGLSAVNPVEGVVRTLEFGGYVLVAGDENLVVAWEENIGLWILDSDGQAAEHPVVCSPLLPSALAVQGRTVWAAVFEAGELWRIDLGDDPGTCIAG
jgi:hypothetical protein